MKYIYIKNIKDRLKENKLIDERKIEILLKEYDSLRYEIIQRMGNRFSLLGFIGAVGAYAFFNTEELTKSKIVVLLIGAISIGIVWIRYGQIVSKCSKRIVEIENKINDIADDKLLTWETERIESMFNKVNTKFDKQ